MEHSASTLTYRLLDGPADLRPLRILALRRFDWTDWTVTIHILGASHAVVLQRGDVCVSELLTCASPDTEVLPVRNRQAMSAASDLRRTPVPAALTALTADEPRQYVAEVNGLECRVCLTPFCLDCGDMLREDFAADSQFEMTFPDCGPGTKPMTRVGWRRFAAALHVETVHTYPEEGRGVRSVSRFGWIGRRE